MNKPFTCMTLLSGLCLGLTTSSIALGVADLSAWVGVDNMAGANNYAVMSATSVGGTFAERRLSAASLSDQTLEGGPFDWDSSLSMSGTVQFTGGFDPSWFFGWYDSTNLNQRIGIGAADPIPAGTGIRWQTQSGNVASTGVVSQNFGATTAASTFAPGTYNFTFNYDGLGHMAGTFDTLNWTKNYALPTDSDLNMDRFGILQKANVNDDAHTFTVNISDITYTGETPFVPSTEDADFDGDGDVDGADFITWQQGLGLTSQTNNDNGDADGSTIVDGDDLDVWEAQFDTPAVAAVGAIPEPSSAALLILAAMGASCCRIKKSCA